MRDTQMTLDDVILRHGLACDGTGGRFVTVSTDAVTPAMFGDLHRATDYSMCSALPRARGMLFMFQRNSKPVREAPVDADSYRSPNWDPHVAEFYAGWLKTACLQAVNIQAFDRFVSLMEERMGDFLMDQCADHSGIGLIRQDGTERT